MNKNTKKSIAAVGVTINSVHLSGLSLSALNFTTGRDVSQCDTFTLTKEHFSTCVYIGALREGGFRF